MGIPIPGRMFGKSLLCLLALGLLLVTSRPSKGNKRQFKKKEGRTDLVLKSKNHNFEIKQGGCPEGWKDGAEVGLGCVVADLSDPNLSEPDAETACEALAEGAHLVEIQRGADALPPELPRHD